MKHVVKMKGWPSHDISLEFLEEPVGSYRDESVIHIDGVKAGSISFNTRKRNPSKPVLHLKTAPIMGTWSQWEDYDLILESKPNLMEATE